MVHHRYSESRLLLDHDGQVGRLVADAELAEYVHLEIAPSVRVPMHRQDKPVSFFVISGCGTLTVESTDIVVSIGDVVEVSAGDRRGWFNNGDASLVLLVVKHQ